MANHAWTEDDHRSIERVADELVRRGWRSRYSLNEVVNGWLLLVHAIENGYDMCIDEYTNDLSIRRWAAEARPLLTPLVRQMMDERLEGLDERFRAATFEAARRLPGAGAHYWWETRLPNLLVGELAEDVERMDLRPPFA